MATWRGAIQAAEPIASRTRILGIKVLVRFAVLDGGVAVHQVDEAWDYDLAWFQGMTLLQIRTLILDEGGPVKALDPPAPPGTFTDPSPPPLRERGQAVFQEWLDAQGARVLLDAITFPLRIEVTP